MKNQKGSAVVWVLILIVILIIIGGIYFYSRNSSVQTTTVSASQPTTGTQVPTVSINLNPANQNQVSTTTSTENLLITSISPSTVSAGQIVTVNGSGFSKTNPNNEVGMSWGKHNPTAIALTNSQNKTVQLSVATLPNDNLLTFLVPSSPACIGVERGCGSSDPASYFLDITPGVYSVVVEDGVTGVESNAVPLTIVATSTANTSTSVSGMTEYTDSSFGFSFWYPSSWTVSQVAVVDSGLSGATTTKSLEVSDAQHDGFLIDEAVFPSGPITVPSGTCMASYNTDSRSGQWMQTVSRCDGATNIPTAYATSSNTMGGLPVFLAQNGISSVSYIVPVDWATNEKTILVSPIHSPQPEDITPIVSTIIPTDSVMSSIIGSMAEQTQTIQAEAKAYGVSSQ